MDPNSKLSANLSNEQRELLESAAQSGYFEVPRKTSLVELARKHGMSDQEASEQLRHGLDVLVRKDVLRNNP